MAKKINMFLFNDKNKKKRKGVHSKNASKNQRGWKKKYRGQGR